MQFYITLLQHIITLHIISFQLFTYIFVYLSLNVVCEITHVQYFYSPGFAHARAHVADTPGAITRIQI